MNTVLSLVCIAALAYVLLHRVRYALHMLQLNVYDYTRNVLWLKRNRDKAFRAIDFIAIIGLALFGTHAIAILVIAILYGIDVFIDLNTKQKKALNLTDRAKRIMATALVFAAAILLIAIYLKFNIALVLAVLILASFPLVMLANGVLTPVEKAIQQHYYDDAARVLAAHKRLIVVGITGSYGKTTTKNIVYSILSQHYSVLKSPASYNTTMGLVITIRTYLRAHHDLFIAEMGAYKRGEIQELCELTQPHYGIVTSIGPQHLESFGSIENIRSGKFELVNGLTAGGKAYLNFDDDNVRSAYQTYRNDAIDYITYGRKGNDLDLKAENIAIDSHGTHFDVAINGHMVPFRTKLLGIENVNNILAGIALALDLGLSTAQIKVGVATIEASDNRLQVKPKENYTLIDDSFNSNPVGAQMALNVLADFKGKRKWLMTPGMIELGEREIALNQAFGEAAAKVCDKVILVGEARTQPIYNGLIDNHFNADDIYVATTIFDAYEHFHSTVNPGDVLLIENDLPDNYDE